MTTQTPPPTLPPVGPSITNGWDAVYAMGAAQINELFFQQYLQDGPTSPTTPVQLIIWDGSTFWLLDGIVGSPEISFSADLALQQCQVSMYVVRGALVQF